MASDFWSTSRFFDDSFSERCSLPSVNIIDHKDRYQIDLAIPGMEKDDIEINTRKGVLYVTAECSVEAQSEGENYTRKEFNCQSFSRNFNLPPNCDENSISASYKNGILSLTILKLKQSANAGQRKIQIE